MRKTLHHYSGSSCQPTQIIHKKRSSKNRWARKNVVIVSAMEFRRREEAVHKRFGLLLKRCKNKKQKRRLFGELFQKSFRNKHSNLFPEILWPSQGAKILHQYGRHDLAKKIHCRIWKD